MPVRPGAGTLGAGADREGGGGDEACRAGTSRVPGHERFCPDHARRSGGSGPVSGGLPPRINLDQDHLKNSLGQLVLTLVKLLHELLERQGIRRIEAGSLTDDQIERLGLTLMRQAQEIDRLRQEFGLAEEDLKLDLGPLGQLL
ncbi:MAG: gas vesicle protein K [Deltaproteobacteria bacterium]|nr:MAG: gas vesicle protein K [Deltaproteobacteria bacterium]